MFKGYKNKEKQYNYDVNFLYFTVSPFATFDRFSQITLHNLLLKRYLDCNKIRKGTTMNRDEGHYNFLKSHLHQSTGKGS